MNNLTICTLSFNTIDWSIAISITPFNAKAPAVWYQKITILSLLCLRPKVFLKLLSPNLFARPLCPFFFLCRSFIFQPSYFELSSFFLMYVHFSFWCIFVSAFQPPSHFQRAFSQSSALHGTRTSPSLTFCSCGQRLRCSHTVASARWHIFFAPLNTSLRFLIAPPETATFRDPF